MQSGMVTKCHIPGRVYILAQFTQVVIIIPPEGAMCSALLIYGRAKHIMRAFRSANNGLIPEVNGHPVGWKQTLARKEGVVVPEVKGHPAGLEADAYLEGTEWMHRK
ncbi:hypothetical protein NDU88_003635 [Pleurodeles waltl]|uniref:Uncharacterized protein n=1 Tax=Pleurodeles waltl TaxID=8319 RepID=A0AAV7MEC2_PLEWA|nr:hypothetical protein NDU88_003635 [Pleurodeles waltl]